MPQYRFVCKACGLEQELSLSMDDYENKRYCCKGCGSTKLQRKYSPVLIKYNAIGFTQTDTSDALKMF